MLNVAVTTLLTRAYPPAIPGEMAGLPDWARRDRYDISTTASLQKATAEDRIAMLRAMLADRFKLVVHTEPREQDVYNLVLARSDGRLGPNITPIETDCEAKLGADRAVRPCSTVMNGPSVQGEITIGNLVTFMRVAARRPIVDKTGLKGSYRVKLTFDRLIGGRGPEASPANDAAPSIFTAVQEQLGMKLEPAKLTTERLVIDRLERPTEN